MQVEKKKERKKKNSPALFSSEEKGTYMVESSSESERQVATISSMRLILPSPSSTVGKRASRMAFLFLLPLPLASS